MTKEIEVKLKEQLSDGLIKSPFSVPWGVTSFAELDEAQRSQELMKQSAELFTQFMLLADNVMFESFMPMDEQFKQLKELSGEFLNRFEDIATDAQKSQGSILNDFKCSNGAVSLYKHNDQLWWAGVPTNKFIDDDSPADIFSDASHRRFEKGLDNGDFPYPDLYLWHIPKTIGKSTFIAYDERGFLIAGGTILPQYEALVKELITNSDEPIGMSHGIHKSTIRRHPTLKHVIDEYNSFEFSFLPVSSAANKLTTFTV